VQHQTAPTYVAVAFLCGIMIAIGGCHTIRFNVADVAAEPEVKERKSFFLWGLVPTDRVDMHEKCPAGVVSLTEQTNVVDGLCDLVTLGIWSPRSTYYRCRTPPAGG